MMENVNWLTVTVEDIERLLREHDGGLSPAQLAQTRVPLGKLAVAPQVFQPRDMASESWRKRDHIKTLAEAAKTHEELDHILVLPVAGQRVVIDGHCRLEAYRKAGLKASDKVPVKHFAGGLVEALGEAARANSRDKLALTKPEKAEAAWRLVCFNEARQCYSQRTIAKLAGVSHGTVGNMQWVLEEIPRGANGDPRGDSWRKVKARNCEPTEWTDEREEKQIEAWAKRLHTHFGTKPGAMPEVFAAALERAWPGLADRLGEALLGPERLVEIAQEAEGDF